VLLDEPFASLDANLREGVREEVRRILRAAGTTTLLVTHHQDEALAIADLVAVLRDGTIVQHAAPRELYAEPVDGELACFVGDANLIDGVIEASVVDTALGKLPARWHGEPVAARCPVTVLIRPEQIAVHTPNRDAAPLGRVIRSGYHGHDTVLHVQLTPDDEGPVVIVRTLGQATASPGESVSLTAHGSVLVWARHAAR
jgi:iron(III) transport system ATP-binding protein